MWNEFIDPNAAVLNLRDARSAEEASSAICNKSLSQSHASDIHTQNPGDKGYAILAVYPVDPKGIALFGVTSKPACSLVRMYNEIPLGNLLCSLLVSPAATLRELRHSLLEFNFFQVQRLRISTRSSCRENLPFHLYRLTLL